MESARLGDTARSKSRRSTYKGRNRIDPDQYTLGGIRLLLGQIVANLLDNAIKYTPPGGSIRVTLSRGLDGVTLVVADTGPGIPADQREHAMTRFARLDTSRHSEGSGLGLSIARVAARVHGASLTLSDNAPGLCAAVHFPKA